MSTYYVPGIVLGPGNPAMNKTAESLLSWSPEPHGKGVTQTPRGLHFLSGHMAL